MTQIIQLKHGGLGLIISVHKEIQLAERQLAERQLSDGHFNYVNNFSSSSSMVSAGPGCGAVVSVGLETVLPGHL